MGLDIYAYAMTPNGNGSTNDVQIMYWRKHHALLDWMNSVSIERDGYDCSNDGCCQIMLVEADLATIEKLIEAGQLNSCYPPANRFLNSDIDFLDNARAAFKAGWKVCLSGDW
jgi:hypothetical protein